MVPPTSSGMRPAARDFRHRRQRVGAEFRRRIALRGVKNIHQAMRISGQHLTGRLGGTDVHAAIDQRRVDTDQLAGQHARQLQCKIGLAGGGGAHQKDGGRQAGHRWARGEGRHSFKLPARSCKLRDRFAVAACSQG